MVGDEVLGDPCFVNKFCITDNTQQCTSRVEFVAVCIQSIWVSLAVVVHEGNIVLKQHIARSAFTLMVGVLEVIQQLLLLHVHVVALPTGHGPVCQFATTMLASKVSRQA
jgi:hypothetical protein